MAILLAPAGYPIKKSKAKCLPPKKWKVPPLGEEVLLCLVTCPPNKLGNSWQVFSCSTMSALTRNTFLKTVPTLENYTKSKKLCIKFDENLEFKKKKIKKKCLISSLKTRGSATENSLLILFSSRSEKSPPKSSLFIT
jgi:hypothetical protein